MIIAPYGGDAWAPAKPRLDETLICTLARAHRWKRLLDQGSYRSAGELDAKGVTGSFVNRLLRLTLLAPDIVEAILEGRQRKGMQLEELMKQMPSEWTQQRQRSFPRQSRNEANPPQAQREIIPSSGGLMESCRA